MPHTIPTFCQVRSATFSPLFRYDPRTEEGGEDVALLT